MIESAETQARVIMAACLPDGTFHLIGDWPRWTRFSLAIVSGLLAPAALPAGWQGFAWDRPGGYIEARLGRDVALYRVIDVVDRSLLCQLEGAAA